MNTKLLLALVALSLGLVFVFSPSIDNSSVSAAASQRSQGKLLKAERAIPGNYIVVLNDQVSNPHQAALALTFAYGGSARHIYTSALRGFSVTLPEAAAIALSRDSRVAYVEEDSEISLVATQTNATWGLDRIDQHDLPLNTTYNYNFTGAGVTAYIIDTGIRATHNEFGNRVAVGSGFTSINDGNGTSDCNGHGTHVSGTVGGATYGVAKNVTLVPVRVLNCSGSGTTSGVIAGVDYVTSHHQAGTPAVANMSLGGGASASLDTAVNNSINDGVVYAIAAGNSNADACGFSPARVANALTVGSTTTTDARSSFSNFGTCVDIFAPGSGITSAWGTSDTATNTISGTSMATPHVTGVAALVLESNPGASVATVSNAIINNATLNKVTNAGTGSPNRLLFSLIGGGGNNPPTASFTFNCTGLTCSFDGSGSSDSDGSIATYSWNFGDGSSDSGSNVNHTYAAGGTFTVSLTVTDNDGAPGSTSQNVTVSSPGGGGITLSVVAFKQQGLQKADLTWSGAASVNVDIYRNGVIITTTANDGSHRDNINARGQGSYTYKVCEAGTSTCSNQATVTF
ncbi:MAG TPA: S8 family serine peptidase [Pyrinomonadaceae bacterium]|nr:S8 family serine peptidase [Pyrinomonadaceae bacterium]